MPGARWRYLISYDTNLNIDSQEDGEEGVDQVVDEVVLHGLDVGGAGETGGHSHVDGGQGQQAGDVDGDDHLVPATHRGQH